MSRGYFGIGVYHPKHSVNIGSLWRSAYAFRCAFVFLIGPRFIHQSSDCIKSWRHVPVYKYIDFEDFNSHRPYSAPVIAIEIADGAQALSAFSHPQRAIYLLGAEDHGLPPAILERCQHVIEIESRLCLNVAVAGSIVMYDRLRKFNRLDRIKQAKPLDTEVEG